METTNTLQQQNQQIAGVIQQQADIAAAAMVAQGKALIDQMAAQAMAQAQAQAAGELVLHARQLLEQMAGAVSNELTVLEQMTPVEIEPATVIDLQPVSIALPAAASAGLPAATRMLNAGAVPVSKAAKRRQRRAAAEQTSQVEQA